MASTPKPKDITVQIGTIDRGGKTHFLSVGEDIPGTKFKIESFARKEIPGTDGTTKDVSEVTIINKETGAKVVLPLIQSKDSPDTYAIFRYKWRKPGEKEIPDFPKRLGETFTLPPEGGRVYKMVEIKGREVVIELPVGARKTLTVPK